MARDPCLNYTGHYRHIPLHKQKERKKERNKERKKEIKKERKKEKKKERKKEIKKERKKERNLFEIILPLFFLPLITNIKDTSFFFFLVESPDFNTAVLIFTHFILCNTKWHQMFSMLSHLLKTWIPMS